MYKLMIFGVGSGSRKVRAVLNESSVTIGCFVDNNRSIVGSYIDNVPIVSPSQIPDLIDDYDFLIIASQYYKKIKKQLISLHVPERKIISFFEPVSIQNFGTSVDIFENRIFSINKLLSQNIKELNSSTKIKMLQEHFGDSTKKDTRQGFLLINHLFGGGTQVYQDHLIKRLKFENKRVYTLNIFLNYIVIFNCNENKAWIIHISKLDQGIFNQALMFLQIDMMYINQLVSFPQYFMDLIIDSKVKYTFFIHDYFCVCPSYNLLNYEHKYCNAETDIIRCKQCISQGLISEEVINISSLEIHIESWRQKFFGFLQSADEIIAPSETAKEIVKKYYPMLPITVKEHELGIKIPYSYQKQYADSKELNIGFVGSIGPSKGSEILYELYNYILNENLPINIRVIGTTQLHNVTYESPDKKLFVHGEYKREVMGELLQKYKVSLVIIPSVCPETFNYTTSEIMAAGYPIITFNIGAPAERLRKNGGGWILQAGSAKEILDLLKELQGNRHRIYLKAEELTRIALKGDLL
ncbi:glycosyltransferase [Paenibacillus sp. MSJ-34]|uniref:glycosyltransferase n=1 Tax=Paenibacillus sp. MSJ-34 TaxID=2841529 RepID=UPI001C10BA75|nr:glycosyltransferase [Paenibacillus sp. MSJ-34]MBU5440999.1 glycosyltransferase [Paenibacillus sp. MSJ-34]